MQALTPQETDAFTNNRDFLAALEVTPMTRSFKMLVLLAMLAENQFPGRIEIASLIRSFRHQASRTMALRNDVGHSLSDDVRLRRLLERDPIAAWVGGRGTAQTSFFTYEAGQFATNQRIDSANNSTLASLTRELCEWRLAQYISRAGGARPLVIRCRVGQASGTPMLWLPDRASGPNLPRGRTSVDVDGEPYTATFVKIAVNVISREGDSKNLLPAILRQWFGQNAGAPGTNQWVVFEWSGSTGRYELAPAASP